MSKFLKEIIHQTQIVFDGRGVVNQSRLWQHIWLMINFPTITQVLDYNKIVIIMQVCDPIVNIEWGFKGHLCKSKIVVAWMQDCFDNVNVFN